MREGRVDRPYSHTFHIMEKKAIAYERTLVSLKADIKRAGEEIQRLDGLIAERKQQLHALHVNLADKKTDIVAFKESSATILHTKVSTIKDAISQRNQINRSIKELERAKVAVEAEIAEKQKQTFVPTGIPLINQALLEVKKQFEILTKATQTEIEKKNKLQSEVANLEDVTRRLASEKKKAEATTTVLLVEADELNKRREAVLKELAREEAKTKAIRNHERDIQAMRRRLTDEYKKVYKSKPRRSTI